LTINKPPTLPTPGVSGRWRKKHRNLTEVENLAQRANTPTRRQEDNLERPVMLTVSPLFACLDKGNPEDRNDRSNNR
jgi:hypothetical protein